MPLAENGKFSKIISNVQTKKFTESYALAICLSFLNFYYSRELTFDFCLTLVQVLVPRTCSLYTAWDFNSYFDYFVGLNRITCLEKEI